MVQFLDLLDLKLSGCILDRMGVWGGPRPLGVRPSVRSLQVKALCNASLGIARLKYFLSADLPLPTLSLSPLGSSLLS